MVLEKYKYLREHNKINKLKFRERDYKYFNKMRDNKIEEII
jgi:hypothetical protein